MKQSFKTNIILSILLVCLLIFSGNIFAQVKSSDDTVVGKIGSEKLYLEELINYYQNNSTDSNLSAVKLRELLPYYLDYKLKLKEGLNQDMDSHQDILNELQIYSVQAAYRYWAEEEITERLFNEFKERSRFEIKSFHILQRLTESASPSDTMYAYAKIEEAKKEFLNGTTLEELDQRYSTQLQRQSAGGQLPWISAGSTVKPFEDALYATEPGTISDPVRTQFGYHLIYVQDIREKTSDRKVRHIFFRDADSEEKQAKADKTWTLLNDGADWDSLTVANTEDGSSRNRGGDIGWIGYGMQYDENFIETVMKLDTGKNYTKPVETGYGLHIFKIDSVRSYKSESQRDEELRKKLENLPWFENKKDLVLQEIAKIGETTIHQKNLETFEAFIQNSDTTDIKYVNPDTDSGFTNSALFTFRNKDYSAQNYLQWLKEEHPRADAGRYHSEWFDLFLESVFESEIVEITKNRFSSYGEQIQQFRDGLIVYKVSDENMWSTSTVDSTALSRIFEKNRNNYRFSRRFAYHIIAASEDSLIESFTNGLNSGLIIDSLQTEYPEVAVISDSTNSTINEHPFTLLSEMKVGQISKKFEYRGRNAVIYLSDILPARNMDFNEAYYMVMNDYQPKREQEFLDKLRKKYKSKIYPNRIK